jgi:hypothetical protein
VGVKDGGELLRCATAPSVYMWQMEDDMVYLDGVDERFQAATGSAPSELIFVSRHASDSGKPTLTVHPIGEARPFVREPLEAFHYQPPITRHHIQNPTPGIPNPESRIPNSKYEARNHTPRTNKTRALARNRHFKNAREPRESRPKVRRKGWEMPPSISPHRPALPTAGVSHRSVGACV